MATESGRTDSPLAQVLFDEPYRFDFFQAVRLLERINPERSPVGRDEGNPGREAVRFRSRISLEFPASEIHQLTRNGTAEDASPPEMIVAFMGLTGPLGVLPHYYTETLMERTRYRDTSLWAFLDIFNHRLTSLFYRAWEKHRFAVAYERGELDKFTEALFDIVGIGTRGLRGDRLGFPDQALIFYGGLIAHKPHSVSAIEAILTDHFGVRARISQFSGQWLKLEEQDLSRIGTANNELGVSTVAGTKVWSDQSKFRVRIGPLTLKEFKAFLPPGSAFKPATELIRFLVGMEFDFDAQLVLKADEVPACALSAGAAGTQSRLGWTSWLKSRPFVHDDSQVVLQVNN
jgi:type VI secretion system protein ImpH